METTNRRAADRRIDPTGHAALKLLERVDPKEEYPKQRLREFLAFGQRRADA